MSREEIEQLQAEVQRLRGEVQGLIKVIQLRDAMDGATVSIVQALANLTMLDPKSHEPLAAILRATYELRTNEPGRTATYREHFDNAFKAILPSHLKPLVLRD